MKVSISVQESGKPKNFGMIALDDPRVLENGLGMFCVDLTTLGLTGKILYLAIER